MADVKVTANGHVFTLRKPDVSAQLDLVEALGDVASNRVYMGMVMPVLYVAQVDGEDEPRPTTKTMIKALMNRIGDEGVAAITSAIEAHFAPKEEKAKKA